MKKKLLLCALATASACSIAAPGIYIAANAQADINSMSDIKFLPGASVGYDFDNNFRASVDYAYRAVHIAGVSTFYDIDQKVIPAVKPYIGIRGSYAFTPQPEQGKKQQVTTVTKPKEKDGEAPAEPIVKTIDAEVAAMPPTNNINAAGVLGLGYAVNNNIALDVNVSLNIQGRPALGIGARLKF